MTISPKRSALETSLRNAARWSLYLSFVLLLVTGAVLYGLLRDRFTVTVNPWYGIDFLEFREVRDLQDLVRIDTTHETGRELDAALWVQTQLKDFGIEAEIEDMGGGKANLVALIEGTTDEFVVLHNHLDTDPVGDPALWNSDPWSAHIEVVWLYARGSFDMKSTVIAQLHAMQSLQEHIDRTGVRPQRGLMLLSTSSEETGSHEGAQHIVEDRPELLDGAWVLLTEGGVVEAIDINVVKYLGVSFGQKRFADVWYSADAIEPLQALRKQILERGQPKEVRVTPSVRSFLEVYGPTRQLAEARILSDPDILVQDPVAFQALPRFYQGLFRDEVHPLIPEPDGQAGGFRMRTVVHLLEGSIVEQAISVLLPNPTTLPEGIRVRVDPSIGSELPSPLDHPAFAMITDQLAADLEEGKVGPYYLAYFANDAQYFRKLDIPSYGLQPFLSIAAESYTVGNYNERIALPTFIEGVERYQRVLWRLLGLDSAMVQNRRPSHP